MDYKSPLSLFNKPDKAPRALRRTVGATSSQRFNTWCVLSIVCWHENGDIGNEKVDESVKERGTKIEKERKKERKKISKKESDRKGEKEIKNEMEENGEEEKRVWKRVWKKE